MRFLIPLVLCLCLLGGCNSAIDVAPGAEAYQQQVGPDGKVSEQRQGVRLRVGTIETQAAPQAAAEKVDDAAEKYQKGSADNRQAGADAKDASVYIAAGLIGLGVLIFLAVLMLGVVLLLRRRKD